jgi:5-amino-6-(5-phosphoribosylamino)uracil reductase
MIPDWDWRARFDAFAAQRTRASLAARLFPFVTVAESRDDRLQPIGNDWSRRLFDGPFYVTGASGEPGPACSLVFVQSADGNTGAQDPAALGGGDTDVHLVYEGLSRVAADAVMAGAGTVRGGDIVFSVWHPEMIALRDSLGLPRHPIQIVVTNRGIDPDRALLFNVQEIRVVLLTGASVPSTIAGAIRARPWVTHLRLPPDGSLRGTFERLRQIGIGRVSCIGGRTLARNLLATDLVDDVYLTTAPKKGGEPDTPIAPGPWRGRVQVRKHGTGPEAGVVFEQIVPAVRSVLEERIG